MTRGVILTAGSALAAAAAALAAAFLATAPAQATLHSASVAIDEAQALSTCNPNPPPSGGGGTGLVEYNDVTNELSWNITFQNLSGPATAAHFHGPAMAGQDAVIQVGISDLTSPSVGMATITETQEADLLAGLWYINYHTTACSGGEIRGQVVLTASVGGASELAGVGGASGAGAAFVAAVAVAALFGTGAVGGAAWAVRERMRS